MFCPLCKEKLEEAIFYGVEIDHCPICLGMFFEEEELRLAKDKKDGELKWLDIDLWKEEGDLKLKRSQKLCPACRLLLYEVNYGDSEIKIDVCYSCKGIWLDRGEFKKIIEYLKEKANYIVLENWAQNLKEEFWEIFTGSEIFQEELLDFLVFLKVLIYKFLHRQPFLFSLISEYFLIKEVS